MTSRDTSAQEAHCRTKCSSLGELQLAVLNVLWSNVKAVSVQEVRDALAPQRVPAYTTVLTVLRSLEKRGLVAHMQCEGERQFRYLPLMTAEDAREEVLNDILNRLFAGSPVRLIQHLLETKSFTPAELTLVRLAATARERTVTCPPPSS